MKIYRVSCRNLDGHAGYSFHSSKEQAEKARNEWINNNEPTEDDREKYKALGGIVEPTNQGSAKIELFRIEPTRTGFLAFLNRYASHNDNG
jgi:hypothetical protein